jgi:hypothetical protein
MWRHPASRAAPQRRERRALCAPGVLALIAALAPFPARAAEPAAADQAVAESLFRQGRELLAGGKTSAACDKFVASLRLDPAIGTLLNLGICHAAEGKTATGWAELVEAAAMARRAGDAEREALARGKAAALEPQLSRIVVRPARPVVGMEIHLDGRALPPGSWGSAVPVDPGPHAVDANAPGRRPLEEVVVVGAGPVAVAVDIPELDPAPGVAPPAGAQAARERTPPGVVAPPPGSEQLGAPASTPSRARRMTGWTLAGVGLAAIGVGSYYGWRTFSKHELVRDRCPQSTCSDPEALAANRDAYHSATVSDVGFAIGLPCLAAAAWLLLSSRGPARGTGPVARHSAADTLPSLAVGLSRGDRGDWPRLDLSWHY